MTVPHRLAIALVSLGLGMPPALHAQAPHPQPDLAGEPVPPESAVDRAYHEFEATGTARTIRPASDGGYLQFPFGHVRPEVHCARLLACLVALEPGERMTDQPLAGDTERWIIATSMAGKNGEIPLVLVKPKFCDTSTNLWIPTDRRVYEIALVSDACKRGREGEVLTTRVKFWYPEEIAAERAEARSQPHTVAVKAAPYRNMRYKLSRGHWWSSNRFPWKPKAVYDDGERTYVVLPEQARHGELPILFAGQGDDRQMINYAVRGDTLVADRLLDRAVLVIGEGKGERHLDILSEAPRRGGEGGR